VTGRRRAGALALVVALVALAGGDAAAGGRLRRGVRATRTKVARLFQRIANRIAPGVSAHATEHAGEHRISTSTRLVPRKHPLDPDVLVTTMTESWDERLIPPGERILVGGPARLGRLAPLTDASPLGQRRIWGHLAPLAKHLDESTGTMRAMAVPVLGRILDLAASGAARFEDGDQRAAMHGDGISVVFQELTRNTVLVRVFESADRRMRPHETRLQLNAVQGILSFTPASGLDVVEIHRGGGWARLDLVRTTKAPSRSGKPAL
jgi:hypothetical protein